VGPEIVPLLAIFCIFGMPMTWLILRTYWRHQNERLQLEQKGNPAQLAALEEEKKQLEARIQNLESIVVSVDFELNQRLARLAAQAEAGERLALPPGPAASPGAGASGAMAATVAGGPATAAAGAPAESAAVNYRLGVLTVDQVVLGRYTVEREIGRGGMGAVYVARDSKLGERVALKVISSLYAGDPGEAAERLRNEVQAARRVTHPNVVRIHDLGEDGPLLFICMEYVEGETLHARVRGKGPLPVPQARELLAEVASGVAAAHAAGVVHRDLKPQNILLARAGKAAKIIDFGLAKANAQGTATATGIIQGTPEYMAPEQVRGRAVDARTDVYALGATTYFALTGRPPFQAESPIATSFAQVHEPPTPPRELRPEIPAAIEAAILRALAKEPAARFPDAEAFRQALLA
jgi:serine/threonine-protein kinase